MVNFPASRIFASLLLLAVPSCGLTQEPKWEAGVGIGGLYLPDYRGSDQERGYILPWPYLVYYGDEVALDREGLRGRLSLSPRISVVGSVSAATPVNSDKNEARAGMPDLDIAFELGPNLEVDMWRGEQRKRLTLEFPLRGVVATDFSEFDYIGWVLTPRLVLHVPYLRAWPGRWDVDVTLTTIYASDENHDYYYRVAPEYATPTRPAYDARAGYSGSRLSVGGSTRVGRYWFGLYARYENLSGAEFLDSPLVRTDEFFMLSAGVAYIFLQSGEETHYHE